MADVNDNTLLRQFAEENSEPAFSELVRRHINLVYSVALRFTGNTGDAEDVAQAAFIILAQKAGRLSKQVVLTGWLYETTRFTAMRWLRTQARRRAHEQEASVQSSIEKSGDDSLWRQVEPHLEAAMSRLGERDRTLLALRYFENKTGAEAAALLGIKEEAARKQTNRALEKLQKIFAKRGIRSTTAILAGTISAHSVSVAPVALAKSITPMALAKGATASTSTVTLIKGALKIMAWTKAKTAIVVGVGVLLAAGTATVSVERIQEHRRYAWQIPYPLDVSVMDRVPPQVAILPSRFNSWQGVMGDGKRVFGTGVQVRDIVWAAYSHFPMVNDRTVFPPGLTASNYDFIANLPKDGLTALQRELERKFGLVARPQMRYTDVLLLTVKQPNSPGLKPATRQNTLAMDNGHIELHDQPLTLLASVLEGQINIPVIDRTGLAGPVDLDLKWNPEYVGPGYSSEPIKKALEDQLGLELVPTNMPFEMLVVEKAK
jgi:uncharacterized protein (TIGR03435 family)